uniref:gliding motility lipoprotein GldH n=1 Tax=Flavobacterium sp. TaxID=239 RepID=UPI0040494A31
MYPKKINFFLIVIAAFFFVSCDKERVFDKYENINGSWKKNDTIKFSFEAIDTIKTHNLFINIRNNNDYPFNNLFLIVTLKQPDNMVKKDTLEYLMANPDGSLMGEGFSDLKENKLWYQEKFIFKKVGTYQVFIEQAVRETGKNNGLEELKGITEVGFRIEKTQ